MTPSEIIAIGLQRTSMTNVEVGDGDATVGDTRLYQYLNMAKDKLWAKYVCSITGKDRSWEEWTTDFTINESEYPLPQVVSDENRLKKVQSLYVTYNASTYSRTGELVYYPAKPVDRATLEQDWAFYCANQPETNPIYYTSDKSIFVAPVPLTTITAGLKLTWVKKIPDYSVGTAESDMVLPDDIHELLIDGLMYHLLYKKGNASMAQGQKNDFAATTNEMLNTERDFHIWPHMATYPPDNFNVNTTGYYSNPNSLY